MQIVLIALLVLFTTATFAQSPESILRGEGFSLITHEDSKDIYYRPREVKRKDGLVYYSTTVFFRNGTNKYSLESKYVALACKEKKIVLLGIHKVPYIGKSSYKDFTTKGIKSTDIKPLSPLDKRMHLKLCKR